MKKNKLTFYRLLPGLFIAAIVIGGVTAIVLNFKPESQNNNDNTSNNNPTTITTSTSTTPGTTLGTSTTVVPTTTTGSNTTSPTSSTTKPTQTTTVVERPIVYDNSINKIKITYPSTWAREVPAGSLVAFMSPPNDSTPTFRENVIVITGTITSSSTVDSIVNESLNQLRPLKNFNLVTSTNTTVAGIAAKKLVHTWTTDKGINVKQSQWYFIYNNKSYIATYTGTTSQFSVYESKVNEILDSVKTY